MSDGKDEATDQRPVVLWQEVFPAKDGRGMYAVIGTRPLPASMEDLWKVKRCEVQAAQFGWN